MARLIVYLSIINVSAAYFAHNYFFQGVKLLSNKIDVLGSSITSAGDSVSILISPKDFLKTILSSRSAIDKKQSLMSNLQAYRSSTLNSKLEDKYLNYIDLLLLEMESIRGNRIANIKWPLPLPSYRVKLAILLRLYDEILLEEQVVDVSASDKSRGQDRKRRALMIILNQLKSRKGVRSLRSEVDSRTRSQKSINEMLDRTPKGLETPVYDVLANEGVWEVRRYQAFSVCTTMMDSDVSAGGGGAFNRLAGYIFGGNKEKQAMAMTTPVIFSQEGSGARRQMSFVMPSAYWMSQGAAPKPMDGSGVSVEVNGGGLVSSDDGEAVAVMWFGGYATSTVISQKTEELLGLVDSSADWVLVGGERPFSMQYNDPFQPPWSRRNEVAVRVKRRS